MGHEKGEPRSTYVQLKEDMKIAAVAATLLGRNEAFTCRVAINAGLELIVAGVDFLKMHGVPKATALEFVERLFDLPGDTEGMHKGGKCEYLLRMAMKIVNGPIVRHSSSGNVLDDAHDEDDLVREAKRRQTDQRWN